MRAQAQCRGCGRGRPGREGALPRRRLAAALVAASLATGAAAATGAAQAAVAPAEPTDGVARVRNAAVPAGGRQTLRARELWRASGEDGDLFFGNVGQVLSGPRGEIYVLDSQQSQVQVFAADGRHLRTLSREGEGPGEVRRPGDMLLLPDGSLGLVQTFPGRIVRVGADGRPAGDFTIGAGDPASGRFAALVAGRSRGGTTALLGIQMTFGADGTSNQTYFLAAYDEAGKQRHTYLSKDSTLNYAAFDLDEAAMDFVYGRWDIGPDGRVYVAPRRDRYLIQVHAPDGRLERVIEREYQSWPRDAQARTAARQVIEAVGRNYPARPRQVTIEETEPDIAGLWAAPGGELWVRTSRGDREGAAGVLAVLDVFDAAGRFTHQLALAAPGDARRDAIYLLDAGRMVVVTAALDAFLSMQGVAPEAEAAEAAAMEVICYELRH